MSNILDFETVTLRSSIGNIEMPVIVVDQPSTAAPYVAIPNDSGLKNYPTPITGVNNVYTEFSIGTVEFTSDGKIRMSGYSDVNMWYTSQMCYMPFGVAFFKCSDGVILPGQSYGVHAYNSWFNDLVNNTSGALGHGGFSVNMTEFRAVTNYEVYPFWVQIMGAVLPNYSWTAWDQIAGNNGQYRNNLTKISSESIGDISGVHYGADSDMERITQSSDVVSYIRNMNYNSPVRIAYSGVNWMTAEIQPDAGLLTNQVKCVFKFYIKNVSETTPFYSLTEYFFVGDADHHYLSFVHDDEQQMAAFLPVGFDKALTSSPYYWGNVSPSESEMNLLWLWLQASGTPTPDPQPSGPYDNGTTDNGGTGGNPIPQDDIHTPNVPVLGAMSSGMFTVYCPTDTQLGQIANYLWSDSFIDNVKKYFNNVSDNIIAFYVLPLEPENLPTKNFKIGNLENASITGVKYLNSRFISVDMGSVTVESRWDTYLDFSPFTRFNCYLPGVGIVALDSDDIMSPANQDGSLPTLTGSTISLTYVIDLFTGVLVAYVKINGQIRYQFPGRMGYSIPLTGQNYTAMGQGFVTAMAGLASTIATGGTAAPFTAGATAAGIVNAMKPDVYRGGNLSGDASMLSLKTPILIRTRPNKPAIENQELFSGAPSYKIDTIGNFGGFTQVAEAHIEGISCTEAERSEIMQLLRNGVLI